MIIIDHDTISILKHLIGVLGEIKEIRISIYNKHINHINWVKLKDFYLSIENLVLEMCSGLEFDKKQLKEIKELYEEKCIDNELLYGRLRVSENKKQYNKSYYKKTGKPRGRPKKIRK